MFLPGKYNILKLDCQLILNKGLQLSYLLKMLYQEAVDRIREDHTIGKAKTGELSGVYGYDIYYNKTNYELAYMVEYLEDKVIVVIMAGTRENFYDQLKQYIRSK